MKVCKHFASFRPTADAREDERSQSGRCQSASSSLEVKRTCTLPYGKMGSCRSLAVAAAAAIFSLSTFSSPTYAFAPRHAAITRTASLARSAPTERSSASRLHAIDEKMMERLDGIRRSFNALTERLADPDVIGDSNLLRQVMSDRSKSEEVVLAFEEVGHVSYRYIVTLQCLV